MFGSQARPGMRSSSSLGTLSGSSLSGSVFKGSVFRGNSLLGSSLGNDQAVMEAIGEASPTTETAPTTAQLEAQKAAEATSSRNRKLLVGGAAALAAYYLFLRKK